MPDPEFGTDAWVESVISDPWMPHYDIREYTREVAAAALEWAAGMIQDDDPTNPPNEDYAERLRAKAREIREGV